MGIPTPFSIKLSVKNLGGGPIYTNGGGPYVPASDGTITVNSSDVANLIAAGAQYINSRSAVYTLPAMPLAASSTQFVASTTLANGTLTIAHQPDVMRQGQVVVFPGTANITAGNVAVTYAANDGTAAQVDNFSLIMAGTTAASAGATLATSKGIMSLTSVVVTALAGGTSPTVEMGTNNYLAMPVDPGFVDFVEVQEWIINTTATTGVTAATHEANGTTIASGGLIAPSVAPAATASYSFGYTYTSPVT
jgi:hypothetical protein